MKVVALIMAAGRGTRLNLDQDIPKQYLPLAGIPMLRHTILSFLEHPQISDVMCIIHPDDVEQYEETVLGLDLLHPVFGGKTRQESVRNGLKSLAEFSPDKVLIHDGARPFVTKSIIGGIIEKLKTSPAVIPAIQVDDTIKKYNDGKIEVTVDRENLWRAQTPQGFNFENILNSHLAFHDISFTDDAALDEYAGTPVTIVPGSQNNFKITTAADYERAQQIIALKVNKVSHQTRIGVGFDVHKFVDRSDKSVKNIRLGGVDVQCERQIEAHSDGDVVLHALVDAMLGSIGQGDIGEHFPPDDDKWKNCDSTTFIGHAHHLLRKKGAKITNIDITIICQQPKISPYKKRIQHSIAQMLNLSDDAVNVKATTTEGLGFTGRGEGIAVQVGISVLMTLMQD